MTGRVIVCGSRDWSDRERIAEQLNKVVVEFGYVFPEPVIVHGNARGADRLAAEEAEKAGLLVEAHPADWETYGKAAGLIRNTMMAKLGADLCIAFWDGRSTGTAHMLSQARKCGIPCKAIFKEDPNTVGVV